MLITPEPRARVFLQNFGELFSKRDLALPDLKSAPAPFWPDVFVEPRLPWLRFLQSGACHALAIATLWAASRILALQPHPQPQPTFTHNDVVYYTPSEYLPPLDTRRADSLPAQKADPEYSAQPIISLPPEAANHSQTIVTPPNVKLRGELALPNTVAWSASAEAQMPIGPAPAVPASQISRLAPQMERSVIAPPPDMQSSPQTTLQAPQPDVIAPPPALEATPNRRLGELNVGHSAVIAPAPQLSVDEQRTLPGGRSAALRSGSPQVIAPPPALGAAGRARSNGNLVALSLHPAVGAPPTPPAGNRRGNLASTPDGHRSASGAPGASSASATNGTGSGKNSARDLPSGLYVGKTTEPANANSVNPRLIANARPPRLSSPRPSQADPSITEAERAVFGNRKIYSLSLNMPNLNSAGGSWIIHFAALKSDSTPANPGEPADLSSPVATTKVDPAYPLELMRQNVSGTVILQAVILADGTVGRVRVLRSVDDRLDQFASDAIAKWKFQPATINGAPVPVDATFSIPFHPAHVGLTN